MSWLNDIVKSHLELESPASFWKWSALAAISAVLKDNVWFSKQIYNLYPNIYVMLHADSGLKKGPPINMAHRMVAAVNNTTIIAGRSSIQGILKEMGTAKSLPGGKIETKNNVFICSSELTSSIVSDPVAMDILTDLYDRHYRVNEYRSLLKMETFDIMKPTITMLAGSNEAHTEGFFGQKDIQGGYFARTFIVYEKEEQTTNSLMFPLSVTPDDKEMAKYLVEISKLKGEFSMNLETRTYFDDWYKAFKSHIKLQGVRDKTGTLNRFDDSVLKVAMLTALGHRPELIITKSDVEQAITDCEKLIGNVRRTQMATGKSQWASQKALLLQELLDRTNHTISREQLNKKYYLQANSNEWDDIVKSLEAGGHLVIESIGNQIVYRMPEGIVDNWKRHLEGKQ